MPRIFRNIIEISPHATRLICVSLLALLGTFAPPNSRGLALATYGALPSVENVALSPDGSRMAYVRTDGDSRIVVIANIADRKMIRWVRASDEKLRSLEWADDDNVMLTTSYTTTSWGFRNEWFLLRVYNVSRNEIRSLPGDSAGTSTRVLNTVVGEVMVRRIDGHTVLFVPGVSESGRSTLFRCDLSTGTTGIVRSGGGSWLVDSLGELAAEQEYDAQTQRWSIKVFRGGSGREAASGHAALDIPEVLGFGPSTDTLLIESIENGQRLWRLLSINDRKFAAMDDAGVFDEPINDKLTGRLIGGTNIVDRPQYVFLDPALDARWKALVKAFDGDAVGFVSASKDFSKFLVLVEGPKYGYRYEVVDLDKNEAVPVGKAYASIDKTLEVRRITYAAADGMQIPAYLTLPRDRPPHKLALVVLPHGGPAARDSAGFDWWSQALADQGYAVLQPNYRGSTIDEHFLEAGYGQWGRKMQTDLSDGVRYLVKDGTVDAARVCIVGASYGGYAALAGVTLDPDVYRCAVSVAGLSDLARMLEWKGAGGLDERAATHYWGRFWGVSGRTDPALDAISPIKHVDAVKVPVLLVHGRDDTVVPFEQTQIMFDALRRSHKQVELVTLKKEDHWLSHGETRLQMLEVTTAFLRAHNPPD
jgi:dipeptidyl aminopeptidase/acylaminoacyl peptidase